MTISASRKLATMMVTVPPAVYECTLADFGTATPTEEVTAPGDAIPGDMIPGDVFPGDVFPGDVLPVLLLAAAKDDVGPAPKPLQMYPPNPVATTSL